VLDGRKRTIRDSTTPDQHSNNEPTVQTDLNKEVNMAGGRGRTWIPPFLLKRMQDCDRVYPELGFRDLMNSEELILILRRFHWTPIFAGPITLNGEYWR